MKRAKLSGHERHRRVAIWPFLKLFAKNKMVWPCFGLFWMLKKIIHFGPVLEKSEKNSQYFTRFYNLFLRVLANFLWKIVLYLSLFVFWGFGLFLKLLIANLAFSLFGTGNPEASINRAEVIQVFIIASKYPERRCVSNHCKMKARVKREDHSVIHQWTKNGNERK